MSQKNIDDQTVSKIFLSRKIILELAKRRGFDISDYESFSLSEIGILFANNQLDMCLTQPKTEKKIYYKYHVASNVSNTHIYTFIEDLFNIEKILKDSDDLVIVINNKPTDNMIDILDSEFKINKYFVNIYNLNNYLYNILDNNLVPSHRVLSDIEKEEISKKYNILEDKQFPEISRFDPVAMAIGLRSTQVTEIIRSSPTALTTKYYRLCN